MTSESKAMPEEIRRATDVSTSDARDFDARSIRDAFVLGNWRFGGQRHD